MARKAPDIKGVRVFPPPPKGFDALAASKTDLARHGLPPRPDPRTQPGPAALWEEIARRYKDFDHLEPKLLAPDKPREPVAAGFGLPALVSCGFELGFPAPITILSGTWTVPDLNHSPTPEQFPNHLHTFFGLGFLDVHVEMTVDVAQNVTSLIRIHTGAQVALPVRPGDAISATLCLQTDAAGTAAYFLANETTSQTVNFTIETGFPPAHAINAGVYSRQPIQRPARSAGSIWRGVLRRAHRLRHQWNTEAHRRPTDHNGRLQWKDTGGTTTPHRFHIQGDLQRRLDITPALITIRGPRTEVKKNPAVRGGVDARGRACPSQTEPCPSKS